MAKITLDLNQFKASGVYTVEFDASERIILTTETIRLVVGFSRKGPFNAPVFLRDLKTARKVFGPIDTFLEKRGSYFHRAIETCLQTGPVFALNLLPLNNVPLSQGGDGVEYRSFSLDASQENGPVSKDLLASWYNKERFWFPDTDNFIAIANNNHLNKNRLFHLVNLSQKPMSFIVRKPNPKVQGYAITAREWYGAGNVPDYVYKFDFIEDYFIEIIAVEGDWTDYEMLSQDPVFSKYFDKRGIRVDKLNEFLALEETRVVANFVGCIIPDFIDRNGSNQFIEVIVNNAVASTGIFCAVNRDTLDDYANSIHKIDLVGHSLISTNDDTIDFLSYNTPIKKALEYVNQNNYAHGISPTSVGSQNTYTLSSTHNLYVTSSPIGGRSGYFANVLVIPKPAPNSSPFTLNHYQEILENLTEISLIKTYSTTYGSDYMKVDKVIDLGNEFRVVLSNPEVENTTIYFDLNNSINNVDVNNNKIQFQNNITNIDVGDILYISGPGFKAYYEVSSVSNNEITIVSNSSTLTSVAPIYADKYAETSLASLQTAIQNNNFQYSDFSVKVWDTDPINYSDLVVNISNTLEIVYVPNAEFTHIGGSGEDYIESYPGSKLALDILSSRLVDGDIIYNGPNTFYYLKTDKEWGQDYDTTSNLRYGLTGVRLRQYSDSELLTQVTGTNFVDFNQSYKAGNGVPFNYIGTGGDLIMYSSAIQDLKQDVVYISGSMNASQTKFKITEADGSKIEVGYFLVNNDTANPKLTRVIRKVKKVDPATGNIYFEIETTESVKTLPINKITVFKPINTYADRLQFTHLSGFKLTDYHLPGTPSQLWKILSVIENTNIGTALQSRDIIQFRYIVDTFRFGIEPMMGAKVILARLAKNRQKCMAILNAPSVKEFIESTDPRFTDEPDPLSGDPKPVLNTSYIADGGNLSLGPSFRFTLPDEENGAKFIGVFSPFLVYRENNKNILVPPAADVSNNFIRKFLTGQPYSIVAGPRRGVLSNPKLVGLEYEYTLKDRENLEPFGINPIVTVRNIGIMIYANQSAYQKTLSAFNNLHVRDLLITIEAAIEDILSQYLFEYNDAATRLEIKSIVENYLDKVRNAGGITDFSVIMDETNNTPEVIDQNFGIIDVGIEPTRGIQKFVNRITILKTGTISSGGFTVA